jgi:hypothetical protein
MNLGADCRRDRGLSRCAVASSPSSNKGQELEQVLILSILPTTIGFTLGAIPSLLRFDLIVISTVTAFSIATVDVLVYETRIRQVASPRQEGDDRFGHEK